MNNGKLKVLVVDDEKVNLELLKEDLSYAGYDVLCACNGEQALEVLENNDDVKLILLDRKMPVMDGMQFIKHQKSHDRFKDIPVIMQTGAALNEEVREGIEAGVYYYLTKPYDEDLLLAIVRAAIDDLKKSDASNRELLELQASLSNLNGGLRNLMAGVFEFRTIEEVNNIAFILANSCHDPKKAILGISEIMINAIEHGNLGITFKEKSELLVNGNYEKEIKHRLGLPENRNKKATVEVRRSNLDLEITVTDNGNGFDWEKYLELSPERATSPNGRGIAMASMFSFDKLEFVGSGNKVICSIQAQ